MGFFIIIFFFPLSRFLCCITISERQLFQQDSPEFSCPAGTQLHTPASLGAIELIAGVGAVVVAVAHTHVADAVAVLTQKLAWLAESPAHACTETRDVNHHSKKKVMHWLIHYTSHCLA